MQGPFYILLQSSAAVYINVQFVDFQTVGLYQLRIHIYFGRPKLRYKDAMKFSAKVSCSEKFREHFALAEFHEILHRGTMASDDDDVYVQ